MTNTNSRGGSRRLLRPVIIITTITIVYQVVSFVTQLVLANMFGSRMEMDAFIAANTLPDYISAVLLGVLGSVFMPIFIEYMESGDEKEAWIVAGGVINLYLLLLGILTLLGVLFAEPILRLTVPGLEPSTLSLAAQIALIIWPGLLGTGIVTILSAIQQARGNFSWPSAITLIGQLANLALVLWLAHMFGIIGVAIAATVSIFLQAMLIVRFGLASSWYKLGFYLKHPGVRQVIYLLWPLVVSGIATRFTPIVDRYLISGLPSGGISHLNYAFKIVELLSIQLSTGLSIVIFPRMALSVSQNDIPNLRKTVSLSLRLMWLAIAPAMGIGMALALPIITTIFQRGQFNASDAEAVASLMRIYLLALISMSLGTITGRSFYALKDTRTPAIIGVFEALAYVVYTTILVHYYGILGAAWGYVIHFNFSLLWQVIIIRYKTGNVGGKIVISSFTKTGIAATVAGLLTWLVINLTLNSWLQLVLGALVGLSSYIFLLRIMASQEIILLWDLFATRRRLMFKRG